jgi:hypothetical protein
MVVFSTIWSNYFRLVFSLLIPSIRLISTEEARKYFRMNINTITRGIIGKIIQKLRKIEIPKHDRTKTATFFKSI